MEHSRSDIQMLLTPVLLCHKDTEWNAFYALRCVFMV